MLILYGVKSAEALSGRFSSSISSFASFQFGSFGRASTIHVPSTGWMMIARIYIYIGEYFAKKRVVFQVSREEKDRRGGWKRMEEAKGREKGGGESSMKERVVVVR